MHVAVWFSIALLLFFQSAVALRDLPSSTTSSSSSPSFTEHHSESTIKKENDHLRRLLSFLDKISVDKTVLMTFGDSVSTSDHQQYGILESWTKGIKKAKISNAFIAAYDDETMEWARQREMPAFQMPVPKDTGKSHVGPATWIGAAKMDAIRDVLSLRFNVLFSDADVLFFENPFPHLDGTFDCETQSDGIGWDNVEWHGSSRTIPNTLIHLHLMPQLNFGLAYVRGTPSMASRWSKSPHTRVLQPLSLPDVQPMDEGRVAFCGCSSRYWSRIHSFVIFSPLLRTKSAMHRLLFGRHTHVPLTHVVLVEQ